ncbi:hypothetical protein [Streptomyces sp. NRRL B-24484]|uniref:hypothetical protein n=1 Tax=Streptomyces sp. NRRL B-24484 TaxID=1463833 RepID=UPI0004BEDF49|nr:hypothetical protein [Streptomyces sp. NRRL B-24484]
MLTALTIGTTSHAGRRTPKGRVRPARTTITAVVRAAGGGWKSACIMRCGRRTGEDFAPVRSRIETIRGAQHEAGAFVPEREWRGLRTTGFVARGDHGSLKWRLHSARSGSYLVWGSAPCGWDGMFQQEYGVRGRRAGVRALQHAIRWGEVKGGVFASHEEQSY